MSWCAYCAQGVPCLDDACPVRAQRQRDRRALGGGGQSTLREDIRAAINRHSRESASNTPDFILAEYLLGCLAAFEQAVGARESWYGRTPSLPACDGPRRIDDGADKQIEQSLNSTPGQGGPG